MQRALNIVLGVIAFVLLAVIAVFFLKPTLDGIGARLDLNGDNFLTADELPPVVRRHLAAIDTSGDGRIGPVELRFYLLARWRRGDPVFEPPEYQGDYSFRALLRYIGQAAAAGEMSGLVLMLGHRGDLIFSLSAGDLGPEAQVPLASATKWLTAAVMGALHDQGVIDLNQVVGSFADVPPSHAQLTIPQMMAHVAGMDSRVGVVSAGTLDNAARDILAEPLVAAPFDEFRYGASSMTLAAWIAEQQTGQPWREIAREYLLGPLGMDDTEYANPLRPLEAGLEQAPEVASGVHSTAADYMKFLGMLSNEGELEGDRQLMRPSTIDLLTQAQSIGAARVSVPPGVTHEFEYAMGAWCETWRNGQCMLLHSQGAFGTRPFLDRQTGIYGIILMVETGREQRLIIQRLREVALRTAMNELDL